MSTTLQDLVNRAVFFSTEMQTHFGSLIADASWDVEFTADPQLTFSSEEGVVLRGRPHLLGSESSGQNTWLWGWENINEFPEPVVSLAHDVRKFGAAEDVTELIAEELELDEELALRLTLASKEVTGKWAHYPAAAGAGTTVWLLVDAPEFTLPEPQVKTTVRALMQGLTQTTVTDHRGALESYVAKRGLATAPLPEEGLRLLFADGCADLSFDDQRRISNCEMHTPLEGEAAEQYAQATGAGSPATTDSADAATSAQVPAPSSAAGSSTAAAPSRDRDAARAEPTRTNEPAAASGPAADTSSSATTTNAPAEATPASHGSTDTPATADSTTDRRESTTTGTSAEATASESDADRSAPAGGPGAGSEPTDESPREDESETSDEAQPNEPKKKKGLFSKLFGR